MKTEQNLYSRITQSPDPSHLIQHTDLWPPLAPQYTSHYLNVTECKSAFYTVWTFGNWIVAKWQCRVSFKNNTSSVGIAVGLM